MTDNPMLAATQASAAARASGKEQTDKGTVRSKDKAPKAKTKAKKVTSKAKAKAAEKMTTIKIPQSLARDLADLAQQVRNNNDEAVAPSDRVYPAHLVQATLERLLELPIDWDSLKTIEEFKQALGDTTEAE